MPSIISVKDLKKTFQVQQKEAGLTGTIKSFVHRKYASVTAVDSVSFDIKIGELVGFIGPNGAGKTTTLKMLAGLLHPTSGAVEILGYEPFKRKHAYLKQIALIMGQKNQLWWDLPATDTFLLNKEIYEISDHEYTQITTELTQMLDVRGLLETPVRKLSLGERMKMELIAALLHTPKVLFLDEPTIGLDVVMQQTMRDFIKQYNEKHQSTIILTSHYMDDVRQLCKRVIVIDKGRIVFDGQLTDLVKKHTKMKYLTVTLEKSIDKERFAEIGEVIRYEFPTVTLSVPREKTKFIAAKLLEDFSVTDIDISEPTIESVIREVFHTTTQS